MKIRSTFLISRNIILCVQLTLESENLFILADIERIISEHDRVRPVKTDTAVTEVQCCYFVFIQV